MNKIFHITPFFLLPVFGFSSHCLDLGTFYSSHREKSYEFDLWGASFSYKIGNSKGLKAKGKVHFASDNALIYLNSLSEFEYVVSSELMDVRIFSGIYTSIHQVSKDRSTITTLTRSYFPIGLGTTQLIDEFEIDAKLAYLFPISHSLIYNQGGTFFGNNFMLPAQLHGAASIAYYFSEGFKGCVASSWTQDFKNTQKSFTLELNFSTSF